MADLQIATVRSQVLISVFTDFESFTTFAPGPQHADGLEILFAQVETWAGALAHLHS